MIKRKCVKCDADCTEYFAFAADPHGTTGPYCWPVCPDDGTVVSKEQEFLSAAAKCGLKVAEPGMTDTTWLTMALWDDLFDEISDMMLSRHAKYGTGNIAKHGPAGILVRMDDKFERLSAGQGNFDDETIEDTLNDIIGYAIIWKLWLKGIWPGSEK